MKKFVTVFLAVLLVFTFVSFVSAQESDPLEGVQTYDGNYQWVPGGLPWSMFIPHYDIAGNWWTGLVIHNLSLNANQYSISFCDNDGYVFGVKEGALTGFQKVAWLLTFQMTGGLGTGWMVIESQFQLLGFVNFGITGVSVTTLGPFFSI
jgi:hypothetical protein